jgi:hypothetical protein
LFAAPPQEDRAHAGCLADAVRRDVAADELHRVVDRQAGGDDPAGRVDVEVNVALAVLVAQKQHLGDDQIGHGVVDPAAEEDDAVLQEPRVDVVRPFAPTGLLNDDGHQGLVIAHFSNSLP